MSCTIHRGMRWLPRAFRAAPTLVFVALLSGCATNPATGEKNVTLMSEAQEIQLGKEADPQVRQEMGVYDDAALQQYVERIGQRLARVSERPDLPWHFTVVDQPAVNAFALPGGFIYITRGILPYLNDEAQLAGVLGHEIGHVTARHAAQQYTAQTGTGLGLVLLSIFVPETRPFQDVAQQAAGLLFLKYSRDDEIQADGLGVRYASRAGWQPAGVQQMLETLSRLEQAEGSHRGVPNWLSTHPAPADRVQKVNAAVQAADAPGRDYVTDRAAYLGQVDGIVFGDDPSQGILRGSTFLHRDLRFSLTFPSGWTVQNSREQVVSKAPDRNDFVLLELVSNPSGSLQRVAQSSMGGAGWRQIDGGMTEVNGLPAYVGTYQGTMQGLGPVVTRAAHVGYNDRVYVIAGLAPADDFRGVENEFNQAIRSFRPLSAAQAEDIRANRVELYTVRSGDTWDSIARRSAGAAALTPATLAIMNGSAPGQPPRAGERIKIVVAG